MESKDVLEFDEFLMMKEKRRIAREKRSVSKLKGKRRNVKNIEYDPSIDYDKYEYDDMEYDFK